MERTVITNERRLALYPYIAAAYQAKDFAGHKKKHRRWSVRGTTMDTVQFARWLSERLGFYVDAPSVLRHLELARQVRVPRAVAKELAPANRSTADEQLGERLTDDGFMAVAPTKKAKEEPKPKATSSRAREVAQFYNQLIEEGLDKAAALELTASMVMSPNNGAKR